MASPRVDLAIRRSHDVRNALHTAILNGGSALLLALIAWTVPGWTGLIWVAILGAFGLWTMSRVSPKMVLGLYKARVLRPDQLPEVQGIVRDLAQRAELPSVPQLYYVPSKILNAFAVGRREDSAIAVTDGLVRSMTMRQLAGILAHETAHIPSGDLRVMALADVLTRVTSSMAMLALAGQTEPRVAVGSGRPDPADPQPAHPLEPHGHMVLMESGFDIRNPTAVAQLDPTIRRK